MRLHIALTQTPPFDIKLSTGFCRPTIASALVAIKVLWVAIRQRPFDLRIRVTVIAFYKRSIGKYYKICPCRSDMISTAAHETAK